MAIVEQFAKIRVALHRAAQQVHGLIQPSAMDLRDRGRMHIRLVAEVQHVALADQSEANEAHADPIIGPQHATIGRGRKQQGSPTLHEAPARGLG